MIGGMPANLIDTKIQSNKDASITSVIQNGDIYTSPQIPMRGNIIIQYAIDGLYAICLNCGSISVGRVHKAWESCPSCGTESDEQFHVMTTLREQALILAEKASGLSRKDLESIIDN